MNSNLRYSPSRGIWFCMLMFTGFFAYSAGVLADNADFDSASFASVVCEVNEEYYSGLQDCVESILGNMFAVEAGGYESKPDAIVATMLGINDQGSVTCLMANSFFSGADICLSVLTSHYGVSAIIYRFGKCTSDPAYCSSASWSADSYIEIAIENVACVGVLVNAYSVGGQAPIEPAESISYSIVCFTYPCYSYRENLQTLDLSHTDGVPLKIFFSPDVGDEVLVVF